MLCAENPMSTVGTLLRFLLWIRFNPVLCIECSFMVREHNFHELPSPPFFTLLFNYCFLICDFFLCQQVNLIFWYRVTFLTYTRSAQWNANLSYVDSRGFQNEILLYKYHTFWWGFTTYFTEINVLGPWRLQSETGCRPSAQYVFCDGSQFQVLRSLELPVLDG